VAALRPEHDGLVIATGAGRATFLPAVWDQLPDPGDFVDRLWRKAGLEPGTWPIDIRTWRYTAEELAG
jgi:AMMECR1 domain-containing protein